MSTPKPTRTTLLGGVALVLVAVIQLVPIVGSWIPTTGDWLSALRGAPGQIAVPLLLLVGCVILSFGYPGERDIVGASVLGRVGFLLVGLTLPMQVGFSLLVGAANLAGAPGVIWAGTALQVLPFAAMVVAAVAVVRAHVLTGFARWILLAVAAAELIQFALSVVQNAPQSYYIAVLFYAAAVPLLLLLSAGVSYAFVGRSVAVRRRLHTIYAAW